MSSTTEESDQIQQRRANLDALRALGVDVYPHGFDQQATVEALKARGHRVVEIELTSGLQALERRGDGWFGGADPRREGVVMGQ